MARGNAFVDYPELAQLVQDLTSLFISHPSLYQDALALALTPNPWPPVQWLGGKKIIVAPYSHLEPTTTAEALAKLAQESKATDIIFSGGCTRPEWAEGDSEARRLSDRFDAVCPHYTGQTHLETRAENTGENFRYVAQDYADLITGSDHVLILMHDLHSRRGEWAARQAFCHAVGIMDEAGFAKKVRVHRYVSDIPDHNPRIPSHLAGIIGRMSVYSRLSDQWERQVKPTPEEAVLLEKLCTAARDYASTGVDERHNKYA